VPEKRGRPAARANELRHLAIDRANHVWAKDIRYLPMQRGFIYLAAVMDWATRRVFAWRVSSTLTADFRIDAVEEAIGRYEADR
jgi:putative transposase